MNKLILTSLIVVGMHAMIFAQSHSGKGGSKLSLGVFGGLNIPQLSGGGDNEMSRDYTSRLGAAFGVTSSYNLGPALAIQADVLYSSEGGQRNGMQAIDGATINPDVPAGTYFYADFNNESILNYIEIPLMVKYSILERKSSKIYANLGPYFGFLLNATQKTGGSSLIYADRSGTMPLSPQAQPFDASTDIKNDINAFNFGVTGGVVFAQKLGNGDIFLDLRAAYGLTTVQKDSKNGKSHNGYLLTAFGYSIPL